MRLKIQQWMMRYLRKRNWVVFYLEADNRKCVDGFCWLHLYEEEITK